jgi:hypothetical protein
VFIHRLVQFDHAVDGQSVEESSRNMVRRNRSTVFPIPDLSRRYSAYAKVVRLFLFDSFIIPPVDYKLLVHFLKYSALLVHGLQRNIPLNILNSNALVLVGGAYENLVVSSVGLKRFNLLGSSSNRTGVSWLGCVVSFSRYLMLKLVISALTVGICRSVCRSVFGTYHGALTIDLRTLF